MDKNITFPLKKPLEEKYSEEILPTHEKGLHLLKSRFNDCLGELNNNNDKLHRLVYDLTGESLSLKGISISADDPQLKDLKEPSIVEKLSEHLIRLEILNKEVGESLNILDQYI